MISAPLINNQLREAKPFFSSGVIDYSISAPNFFTGAYTEAITSRRPHETINRHGDALRLNAESMCV